MNDPWLRRNLEQLHTASYGWAVCCCGRNHGQADEVLQRTYLKVLDGSARFDGSGDFKTWLFAVIRRTAADERRWNALSWRRLIRYAVDVPIRTTGSCEGEMEGQLQLRQLFANALSQLPSRQRELLHLVFYENMTVEEAAAVMAISVGAARQHYARGKNNIRNFVEFEPGDEPRARQSGATNFVW